jgi:hypothetical protein
MSLGQEVRLKDYLVYRPPSKAILALRECCAIRKLRDAALLIKALKVMKEGIYIGAEYYNYVLFFGDHVYFEILCTMTTVTQWKVLKQGVHCILLLIDIFLICLERV